MFSKTSLYSSPPCLVEVIPVKPNTALLCLKHISHPASTLTSTLEGLKHQSIVKLLTNLSKLNVSRSHHNLQISRTSSFEWLVLTKYESTLLNLHIYQSHYHILFFQALHRHAYVFSRNYRTIQAATIRLNLFNHAQVSSQQLLSDMLIRSPLILVLGTMPSWLFHNSMPSQWTAFIHL